MTCISVTNVLFQVDEAVAIFIDVFQCFLHGVGKLVLLIYIHSKIYKKVNIYLSMQYIILIHSDFKSDF